MHASPLLTVGQSVRIFVRIDYYIYTALSFRVCEAAGVERLKTWTVVLACSVIPVAPYPWNSRLFEGLHSCLFDL